MIVQLLDTTFEVGQEVLAKWTDRKEYKAVIMVNHPDGMVTIRYEDGIERKIKTTLEIDVEVAESDIDDDNDFPSAMLGAEEDDSDDSTAVEEFQDKKKKQNAPKGRKDCGRKKKFAKTTTGKGVASRKWEESEISAVRRHLQHCIMIQRLPGASQIRLCMSKEPVLKRRTWKNIKDFCRNEIRKLQKQ